MAYSVFFPDLMFFKPRTFHRRQISGWMTTLAISLCALQCGYAEALPASFSPNVTIRGDLLSLRRLPFLLKDGECPNRDCTVRIAPINVSVVVKGYGVVSLVFSEAEDTRLIRRELPNQSVNDIAQRPVLLRGVGFRRHLGERGERIEFPVAGTIYQDGSVPQLEIALSHLNRRAPDRVVVARASLAESLHGNGVDGRAIHASSYAFATASCGTHDSGRQSSQLRVPGVAPLVSTMATTKLLYLGTDFDRDFMKAAKCKTASQCNNRIVSYVNQASVYYQRQLDTRLRVDRQYGPVTFTAGTSYADQMLDDYGSFIESYRGDYLHDGVNRQSKMVDGYVGFTGKKMLDGVIGIAWMGVFCDNSSALQANTVIRQYSESLTGTTIAHELGHNLNANHSAAGIMAASASKTGKNPRFTSDSVEQISTYTNGWYDECRAGVNYSPPSGSNPYAPTLGMTVGPASGYNFSISLSLQNKRANCRVQVRSSETAGGVTSGTIIFETAMEGTGSTRMGNVWTAVDATNASEATVYFKSFYICSGEQVRAESEVVSFVALYGPSYSDGVSRAEWIQELADRFNW